MKVLLVHPSALMYSEIFLRLEPLGLESIARSIRLEGHEVRLLDLQVFSHKEYLQELPHFGPQAIGFSLNYFANVPEVIDLAKVTRQILPKSFIFVGGHSASFIPESILEHAQEAIDCVVVGEGELTTVRLLESLPATTFHKIPGVVAHDGRGPKPELISDINQLKPARDLTRKRRKYFIGGLDPCASIEFARGCQWDCSFCSAWTFYGQKYRTVDPRIAAQNLAAISEPNVFITDDVAFVDPDQGLAIGREIERRNIRKRYYLETRADVLLRNLDLFAYWKRLGLTNIFLGIEAIDEETLRRLRKRTDTGGNFKALEAARKIGLVVALNIIADPDWDEKRFEVVRNWAISVPEIVHLTINTPYPGTEVWHKEAPELTTLDYRLYDIQHAVKPTRLPLKKFYEELVSTQGVLNRKHLGLKGLWDVFGMAASLCLRGHTNFVKMLWKFSDVYNPERQLADHHREIRYRLTPPVKSDSPPCRKALYVHETKAACRRSRDCQA
ncbi:MAG: hopanoid C-3 methylase HpnR [Syntrophobacteraceae bacterium]|nr:hopanoid C-3 methylase HpnR [Syntrophobacteraceae bacterium]